MSSAKEIRQQFLDFFIKKHGHTYVPSSPVVPHDDPTLLFTNAGMNQFKDVFLGTGTRPYKRAANTQKCIRAGGKHNDLDDVGKDTYHHTFFEMLGNWSFGDYFKKEAIAWAWELLTEVWQLDKSRLHATVFEGMEGVPRDDEAYELWRSVTDIDPAHIHWGNRKDNFWEMGDTGPCGPCTEIHVDRTRDKTGGPLVNKGSAEVMEIWNLVFIQYNRNADRTLTPLPARHVDTGMGFERVTAILEDKASNYDTDVFTPIFAAIQKITGSKPYGGRLDHIRDTAYRVVADHIRALTFALTDGARPGNEGRDYVLRRILRRAERYGRQYLGAKQPFLHELVPTIVELMGDVFPELTREPGKVAAVIHEEEESFIKTLDRGMKLFKESIAWDEAAQNEGWVQGNPTRGTISGAVAFKLHDTYGLYIDIVEQMASEEGVTVDRAGFEEEMKKARELARGARKKHGVSAVSGTLPRTDDSPKYGSQKCHGKIVGWVADNTVVTSGKVEIGDEVALLLDRTCFYAEQGGQVGDTGAIHTKTGRFTVQDTQRLGDAVLHVGQVVDGTIEPGQSADLIVSNVRLDTMRNHTATHLLNWALRHVLGEHVEQKGSLVDAEKTRFDFTHNAPLTSEEVAEVERLVNDKVLADLPVTATTMPLNEAKKLPGVRAVFGEKYPDPVRVLTIGPEDPKRVSRDDSVEFCGGTHLSRTSQACLFKIVGQEGVAKGVRRITAITGHAAVNQAQRLASVADALTGRFNCQPEDVLPRVEALQDEVKKLQQQLRKGAATDLAGAADRLLANARQVGDARIVVGEMPAGPDEQLRAQVDRIKQTAGSAAVVVGWNDDGKVGLIAAVTDDLVKKGVHAGKLVGEVAKVVGGGGGGRPTMAQAGGKEPMKLPEALERARQMLAEILGK